jgi:hypothetical protein
MQFWFPGFLFASLAIAVPVLVHLFSFRTFKNVYFPDIRFLKDLKEENRHRSRLRHLLILTCRCLALLMLVLAFAKPYFDSSKGLVGAGPKIVNVFLDNSFSMDGESSNGLNLEVAKAKAAGIAEGYGETDRFRLITQDFDGVQSRLLTREEFLENLSRIEPGPGSHNMQEIADRMRLGTRNENNGQTLHYVVSDFQRAPFQMEQFRGPRKTNDNFFLCPLEKTIRGNISIDSVWFSEPIALGGEPAKLMVQLQNHGEEPSGELPVSLMLNGIQKAVGGVSMDGGEKKTLSLSYLHAGKGWQLGQVSISDAETPFDNTLFFSYEIAERASVLQLAEKDMNPYVRAVFGMDSLIEYSEMNQSDVQYQNLRGFDLIILCGWGSIPGGLADGLSKALAEGSTLAIIPPAGNIDLRSYQSFLQAQGSGWYQAEDTTDSEIGAINYGNSLFKGVFSDNRNQQENIKLPAIKRHYKIEVPSGKVRDFPLVLRDGSPYVAGFLSGGGKIFLIGSSIQEESGNFHRHGIFVPSFFRMAFQRQVFTEISVNSGRREPFMLRSKVLQGDQMPKMILEGSKEAIIPVTQFSEGITKIFIENHIKRSGHYRLSAPGEDTLGYISVNYERAESDQRYLSKEDLEAFCDKNPSFKIIEAAAGGMGKKVREGSSSGSDWKIFLFFSLIFLFFELLLQKLKN